MYNICWAISYECYLWQHWQMESVQWFVLLRTVLLDIQGDGGLGRAIFFFTHQLGNFFFSLFCQVGEMFSTHFFMGYQM